jgi:hypothetical protein
MAYEKGTYISHKTLIQGIKCYGKPHILQIAFTSMCANILRDAGMCPNIQSRNTSGEISFAYTGDFVPTLRTT